jgi:hypothetical protein
MGNCAAPPLAIIFMDRIEQQIIEQHTAIRFWKRYIDDIFFITSDSVESLLQDANLISPAIKFTLEMPQERKIAFLDCLVHANDDGNFSCELFIKSTHSGTCLSFNSFVPKSRLKSLVISENLRAIRRFPSQFINQTLRSLRTSPNEKIEYLNFLKIPFRSEWQRRKIINLAKETGCHDKIRLIFSTERPLSWLFRPPPNPYVCPSGCAACSTSIKSGTCFIKHAVYKIQCQICSSNYIGQTGRCMRSRILEHINNSSSHVNIHMTNTHGTQHRKSFKWKILAIHPYTGTRLALEAFYIRGQQDLMNGCEGMKLLQFL